MTFKYIWAIIKTEKKPPIGSSIQVNNLTHADYILYPFHHKEKIFTVDLKIWNLSENRTSKALEETSYWPTENKIKNLIKDKINSNFKLF